LTICECGINKSSLFQTVFFGDFAHWVTVNNIKVVIFIFFIGYCTWLGWARWRCKENRKCWNSSFGCMQLRLG